MLTWALQVYDTRDEKCYQWIRKSLVRADTLEDAVTKVKDLLLWPFSEVQETLAGDEAQFLWAEKNLQADLWLLERENEEVEYV